MFVPGSGYANYCMASVVCDKFGNLYYTNDSCHLFCVKSQAHRVKFDTQGGSSIDDQTPASGSTVAKPADPTREGYTFAGWFSDAACTKAYDFATAVTADMTLYAKWVKYPADNNGGNGNSNGNAGGSGNGANSGNGTSGQQGGGAVAPGQTPVSTTTTTETKDGKDSKKDSDKKDRKSDKKNDKSDTGSSASTAAKKSSEVSAQESGFNPLAIVGVAAGVIGLAVIGVFALTKRR